MTGPIFYPQTKSAGYTGLEIFFKKRDLPCITKIIGIYGEKKILEISEALVNYFIRADKCYFKA